MRPLWNVLLALTTCATVPIEKHDDYDSLMDYLKRGYQEQQPERFQFFHQPSRPLPIVLENRRQLVYVGDQRGDGYCLTAYTSHPADRQKLEEKIYCTLYGSQQIDAYSWGTIQMNGTLVQQWTGLRRENPAGLNGENWPELQVMFEELKLKFINAAGNDSLYQEAVRRMRIRQR